MLLLFVIFELCDEFNEFYVELLILLEHQCFYTYLYIYYFVIVFLLFIYNVIVLYGCLFCVNIIVFIFGFDCYDICGE